MCTAWVCSDRKRGVMILLISPTHLQVYSGRHLHSDPRRRGRKQPATSTFTQ